MYLALISLKLNLLLRGRQKLFSISHANLLNLSIIYITI